MFLYINDSFEQKCSFSVSDTKPLNIWWRKISSTSNVIVELRSASLIMSHNKSCKVVKHLNFWLFWPEKSLYRIHIICTESYAVEILTNISPNLFPMEHWSLVIIVCLLAVTHLIKLLEIWLHNCTNVFKLWLSNYFTVSADCHSILSPL